MSSDHDQRVTTAMKVVSDLLAKGAVSVSVNIDGVELSGTFIPREPQRAVSHEQAKTESLELLYGSA